MNRTTALFLFTLAACFGGCSTGAPLTEPQGEWSAVNAGQPPPVDPTAKFPVPLLPPPVAEMGIQAAQTQAPASTSLVRAAPNPSVAQEQEIHLEEATAK